MKNFSISRLASLTLSGRKRLNLTQQELADRAGINRSMLCRLENQDYVPSLDQLTRLANTLGFDAADVFIEYNPPVFNPVVPKNITVFGAGRTGLSFATLLARHHRVTLVDTDPAKVDSVNRRVSPVPDEYIERHFARADLKLTATQDGSAACRGADFAVIAVPSGYVPGSDRFDFSAVESAIHTVLDSNPSAVTVIRSDLLPGCTASLCRKFDTRNILYSPEFQRESSPLYDNLYPGRIIVGCDDTARDSARVFADMLKNSALQKDAEVLLMGLEEAESVKLFSDTCLALRVSFFNELDTYAESRGLQARDIIRGVCLDPRIGDHYNNPSFGCGGFFLPRDIRQLTSGCGQFPRTMMTAVVEGGRDRMDYIASRILELAGLRESGDLPEEGQERKTVIGVFRLSPKAGSSGFRRSAVLEIMKRLRAAGASMVIFEPALADGSLFLGSRVVNDLRKFKKQSSMIIANRYDACLDDVERKVYTRDLFGRD